MESDKLNILKEQTNEGSKFLRILKVKELSSVSKEDTHTVDNADVNTKLRGKYNCSEKE